jgi:hypothetical protein
MPYRMSGAMWDQCLVVAIASITGVEPERIGRLEDAGEKGWFSRLCDLLEPHGWTAFSFDHSVDRIAPAGYAVACGPGYPDPDDHHAVVALDGQVVHDPDRGDLGIREIAYWIIPVPIFIGQRRLQPLAVA